jgi:hypothetical protein
MPSLLAHRDDVVDETEMMRRQMNPMANNMAFDADTAFKTERTALAAVSPFAMIDQHPREGFRFTPSKDAISMITVITNTALAAVSGPHSGTTVPTAVPQVLAAGYSGSRL